MHRFFGIHQNALKTIKSLKLICKSNLGVLTVNLTHLEMFETSNNEFMRL